jgi:CxxC motif-containing protein (DUF1111 family)
MQPKPSLFRQLFEHKWVAGDSLSPEGDGLGPMHNANSCVACHHLGGMGGAGAAEENVELLSVVPRRQDSSARKQSAILSKAGKFHPAFSGGTSVLFHRLSTEPRYERWRLSVFGFKLPADEESTQAAAMRIAASRIRASDPPVVDLPRKFGVRLRLSQRNTTPLFGAGLIDSIPEKTLIGLAKEQEESGAGIEGRVGRTADGKVGRFGWRGQVATLRDFVLTACAMELGLQNASHPQGRDPLHPKKILEGNDLTEEQCNALVAYIASLPAPQQIAPSDAMEWKILSHGGKVFDAIGCAACHVQDVGNVEGIFSDLLLHDMGPALEDPLAAVPDRSQSATISTSGSSAYGGGSSGSLADVPPRLLREWKTPPLWGVRDSAPYLHDGRARTIEEAIAAHGGEAEDSAKKFKALNYLGRSYLLAFLNSLAAPQLP